MAERRERDAELAWLLRRINENEYSEYRDTFIFEAIVKARTLGYTAGVRFDTEKPALPVCCIHLPDGIGEVAWSCTPYSGYWGSTATADETRARSTAFVKKYA